MKGVNSYICSMMCLFCVISFTLDSCDLMTDIQLLLSSCNVLAFLVVMMYVVMNSILCSSLLFSSLLCCRYKCPNGHLYTVGACTYPMEERVCTAEGCNAKIGGTNHVVNAKNKRLDMNDADFQGTPGYHTSVANDSKDDKLCLSKRIMRLLTHGLMVASMEIKHAFLGNNGNIAKAMSATRTSGFYVEELHQLFNKDLLKIKKSTGYSLDDVSMGLHLAFSTFCVDTNHHFPSQSSLSRHVTRYDISVIIRACVRFYLPQ